MKTKFVDHLFSKIVEGRYETGQSIAAVNKTLKQLEEVKDIIQSSYGDEAVHNVLSYKVVKRALEQCLDFISNLESSVQETDFEIYYFYAESRLQEAEKIIDSNLGELKL
ncbi:hypothetical protein HWV01_16055 [Moritella sp. 5]|uniref:hypothetical protein n=1 Tax=Moritella sp. 5 TaxID=2746231 RepID=UPI001BA67395|nr:hypothetical protein [Moritella sp. 5]QUM81687.1 hypothetical protein HWV01_16055 [Moritella sp. 5]